MARESKTLIMIEDNAQLAEVMTLIFSVSDDYDLLGVASDMDEGLELLARHSIDLAIVDIELQNKQNGIDFIRHCSNHYPTVETLVHTIHEDSKTLFSALKAGASGYILKGLSPVELFHYLDKLKAGEVPMSPKISRRVLAFFRNENKEEKPLSKREIEILELADRGFTYQQIADKLIISKHTVHTHFKNIYSKLKVTNRSTALSKAKKITLL